MKFFTTIKNAVYNPSFYADTANFSYKASSRYFLKLMVVASLVMVIIAGIFLIPTLRNVLSTQSINTVSNFYPKELLVTVKNGQVSTNVKEPFAVLFPESWKSAVEKSPSRLVVFDTKSEPTIGSFASYDTLVLVTKDYVLTKKDDNQISVMSVKNIPDTIMDQMKWTTSIHEIASYGTYLIPFLLIGLALIFFVLNVIANLIFILFGALIVWLIELIRGTKVQLATLYLESMYLITPLILIELIAWLFGISLWWYVDIAIFLITYFVNIRRAKPVQA